MYVYALASLGAALLWILIDRRGDPRSLWFRFALGSFAAFSVVSALAWILAPGATVRLVTATGNSEMVGHLVKGRALILLPMSLIALQAARSAARSTSALVIGPLVYNAIMMFETTRVQFTPLFSTERWLYVAMHFGWALSFAVYLLRARSLVGAVPVGSRLVAWSLGTLAVAFGATLFLAPGVLIPMEGSSSDILLIHSAHAFAAAATALGAVALGIPFAQTWARRLGVVVLAVAGALLAILALSAGLTLVASLLAAWAILTLAIMIGATGRSATEDHPAGEDIAMAPLPASAPVAKDRS